MQRRTFLAASIAAAYGPAIAGARPIEGIPVRGRIAWGNTGGWSTWWPPVSPGTEKLIADIRAGTYSVPYPYPSS